MKNEYEAIVNRYFKDLIRNKGLSHGSIKLEASVSVQDGKASYYRIADPFVERTFKEG